MDSQNDITLNDVSNYLSSNDLGENDGNQVSVEQTSQHEFSLPPTDRGKDAWLFLAAGFVVEALVWGQWEFPSRMPPTPLNSKILTILVSTHAVVLTYFQASHSPLGFSKSTTPHMNRSRPNLLELQLWAQLLLYEKLLSTTPRPRP